MKEAENEKYLGDVIDKSGKIQETINKRLKRGEGIISEILSILSEIPLGKYKIEAALKLREAMLLNGVLFNSEAWHGVTSAQVVKLEQLDESLLRGILNAHSRTAKEFLYLETGTIPIRYILAQRRINYLKHILSRDENELIRKIYTAQKNQPTRGDFVVLVKQDLDMLGMSYEEATSSNMSKKILKAHATSVAFEKLVAVQNTHIKVNDIQYGVLGIQPYLKSELFSTKETHMLTALRSHCVREIRANFSRLYRDQIHCQLQCNLEQPCIDSQKHILVCNILKNPHNIEKTNINFIYGTVYQQHQISKLFCSLIKSREKILETNTSCLPGASFPDQSPRQQQQQGVAAGQSSIVMQLG